MIYDCFMFFNELDLLEIRLEELSPYVDKFVLVESEKTHSNKKKKLYFEENKSRYEKFKDKIIHLVIKDFDNNKLKEYYNNSFSSHPMMSSSNWLNEAEQRNYLENRLLNCDDEDIIMISDIDEIPNMEVTIDYIKNLKDDAMCHCYGKMFYYYLNLEIENNDWVCTKITKYKTLKKYNIKFSELFRTFDVNNQEERNRIKNFRIPNSGWHFSYLGNKNQIKEKLSSFMHQEMINENILTSIDDKIKNLIDPFNRTNMKLKKVEIDSSFPKTIIKNIDKYTYLILN